MGFRLGPADAAVTLTTFIDYMCPFSERIFNRLLSDEFRARCHRYIRFSPRVCSRIDCCRRRPVCCVQAAFPTLRLEFYQCPQPWHPQGTPVHEASKPHTTATLRSPMPIECR